MLSYKIIEERYLYEGFIKVHCGNLIELDNVQLIPN